MKYDCGFQKENYWFRYRACGFLRQYRTEIVRVLRSQILRQIVQ